MKSTDKKNHKYNRSMWVIYIVLIMAGVIGNSLVAFAGEINSDEARVISAASGTFSYDGKNYRAGTVYINSLTTYLSADDVDLTADQADAAISKMYASVGDGIRNGYLYEVEDSTSQTEATSSNDTSNDTKEDDKDSEKEVAAEEIEMQENTSEPQNSSGEQSVQNRQTEKDNDVALDIWNTMSNPTESKAMLQERPEKEDASASVEMESDAILITTDDGEFSISKSRPLISDRAILLVNVLMGVVFGITVTCAIVLFFTKCLVFRKPKSRRARPGHSKRRKIRRYCRDVLTVTTLISLISIFVFAGSYTSLFNQNTIMQNMQSSGYFNYAYSEYISEKAHELVSNTTEQTQIIQDDKISTYEEYMIIIKQNSEKILNGETDVPVPSSNVTPYIYNAKKSYMKLFYVAGVLSILSTVLGIILMIIMDQRRERGVKSTAIAELIASGILIAVTVFITVTKPYENFFIEPDYLYLFIMKWIDWMIKVMMSIVAFGVVIGMLLLGVYQTNVNSKS